MHSKLHPSLPPRQHLPVSSLHERVLMEPATYRQNHHS
jgi:hypothetical protein